MRLRGVPLFSWLTLGLLAMVFGGIYAIDAEGASATAGLTACALGAALCGTTLAVSVDLSETGLRARNLLRSRSWSWSEVATLESVVSVTFMTGAIGFGQLAVRGSDGRRFRLLATTGAQPEAVKALLADVNHYAGQVATTVDLTYFPTLQGRAAERSESG